MLILVNFTHFVFETEMYRRSMTQKIQTLL